MSGGDESDEELTRTNKPLGNSNESEKRENRKTYRKLFLKLRDDIRYYKKRYPKKSRADLLEIFNDKIGYVHKLKGALRPPSIDYDTFIYHLLMGIDFTNIDDDKPQASRVKGGGKKRRRKKQSKRRSKKHKSKKYKSRRGRKTRRR